MDFLTQLSVHFCACCPFAVKKKKVKDPHCLTGLIATTWTVLRISELHLFYMVENVVSDMVFNKRRAPVDKRVKLTCM